MADPRANFVEVPSFFFILKAVQLGISVIVLALSAASIAVGYGGVLGWPIVVCLLTWISVGYYIASTRFVPKLYNRFIVLILEVKLWILWLTCWTTLAFWASVVTAVYGFDYGYDYNYYGGYSVAPGVLQGLLGVSAALSAINWVLIFTTAVIFIIHFLRFRRGQTPAVVTTAPKYEMQPQQQPQYTQQVPVQQYPAQGQYVQQQYVQPQAQFDQSGEHKVAV